MLQLHWCEPSVGLVENLMFGVCFLNSLSLCIPSDLPFAARLLPKDTLLSVPWPGLIQPQPYPTQNQQLWGALTAAIPSFHICLSCSQAGPWQHPRGLRGAGENQAAGCEEGSLVAARFLAPPGARGSFLTHDCAPVFQ